MRIYIWNFFKVHFKTLVNIPQNTTIKLQDT